MKKILLTGSTGFIGKNMIARYGSAYEFLTPTRASIDEELNRAVRAADMIIHLAGVSRPQDPQEFYEGNSDLTKKLIDALIREKKIIPLAYTSSIHADMDNDFGKSKRLAEECILAYGTTGAPVHIVRLTNTFGRWAKPNAHSVIATFCYNISHDMDIQISDPFKTMDLAYVDDVVDSLIGLVEGKPVTFLKQTRVHFYEMTKTYHKTLGEIADAIALCKKGKGEESDEFLQRMDITYQSYALSQ